MNTQKIIKQVEGEKIIILPFYKELITNRYVNWFKDEKINYYLQYQGEETTLDDIRTYVHDLLSNGHYFFAVLDKETKLHIGNVRIEIISKYAHIGKFSMIIGDSNYHGKGIGTEVVKLVIDIAFNQIKLRKLTVDVVSENTPAVRVYEKNNFIIEGRLKECFFKHNKYFDFLTMSIFNRNFEE